MFLIHCAQLEADAYLVHLRISVSQLHLQASHCRIRIFGRCSVGLEIRYKLLHGTAQLLLLINGMAACALPAALRRIGWPHYACQTAARIGTARW
jgi:hypothetical protein